MVSDADTKIEGVVFQAGDFVSLYTIPNIAKALREDVKIFIVVENKTAPRLILNDMNAKGVQDISGRKLSRGFTRAQAHTIRLWQTPIRYSDKPVWVAQASTRLGGRFAEKAPVEVTSPINPKVDEARYDLAQDLAYSQALIKIGFIKGSGRPQPTAKEEGSRGLHYTTDGLRVVLVFGNRPASLGEIDFFDWERLDEYR